MFLTGKKLWVEVGPICSSDVDNDFDELVSDEWGSTFVMLGQQRIQHGSNLGVGGTVKA